VDLPCLNPPNSCISIVNPVAANNQRLFVSPCIQQRPDQKYRNQNIFDQSLYRFHTIRKTFHGRSFYAWGSFMNLTIFLEFVDLSMFSRQHVIKLLLRCLFSSRNKSKSYVFESIARQSICSLT
jgi:hypothetical protein